MKTAIACLLSFIIVQSVFAELPPKTIPSELYDRFTMGGKIPVLNWYLYEVYSKDKPNNFLKSDIDDFIQRIQRGETGHYGKDLDSWLYAALDKYPIQGKDVVIIGSQVPWYECIVIAYGGHPITIDYNTIVTDDPRITPLTVDEFNKNPRKFDVILSVSSIEHDGLGRYGDPINPDADLEFMTYAKTLLKEGGHMILSIPVGLDVLVWNAHRIYGPLRFPLLIQEWNLIDAFGFTYQDLGVGELGNWRYQPVFYLEPK